MIGITVHGIKKLEGIKMSKKVAIIEDNADVTLTF